jgi:predicted kinase
MPTCYQLIGVPGSGKSTWIKNQPWAKDAVVVSTDNHVEDYAEKMGKTYSEVFDKYMPIAVQLMTDDVINASKNNLDIIWDQTSTTVASRKRKFKMLPNYKHIAVVFTTPNDEELKKRLGSRPGKTIPDHVIRSMINNFEMPTKAEGFSDIIIV